MVCRPPRWDMKATNNRTYTRIKRRYQETSIYMDVNQYQTKWDVIKNIAASRHTNRFFHQWYELYHILSKRPLHYSDMEKVITNYEKLTPYNNSLVPYDQNNSRIPVKQHPEDG